MNNPAQGSNWRGILALFIAGVAVAGQVGKAPVAIPAIRIDLGLSLTFAAWIVSIYSLVAAAAGLPIGVAIGRIGMRRSTIIGLIAVAVGSTLGALAPSGAILLASRVLESFGYLTVSVAAPSLMRHFASERDRDSAMVLWSLFMPVGSSLVMFLGPLILQHGWRDLWLANTGFAVIALAGVVFAVPPRPVQSAQDAPPPVSVREAIATPGIALVCGIYIFYVFQYFALVGMMPTYLVEYKGMSVAAAGTVVAAMIAGNVLGNIIAGFLMRYGVPVWILLVVSFGSVIVTAPVIFSDAAPLWLIVVMAFAALLISAMTPASMWSSIPRLAPSAAIVGMGFGLLTQGSGIGQLTGASAMGAWVEHTGWAMGWVVLVVCAAIGVVLSLQMRGIERNAKRPRI